MTRLVGCQLPRHRAQRVRLSFSLSSISLLECHASCHPNGWINTSAKCVTINPRTDGLILAVSPHHLARCNRVRLNMMHAPCEEFFQNRCLPTESRCDLCRLADLRSKGISRQVLHPPSTPETLSLLPKSPTNAQEISTVSNNVRLPPVLNYILAPLACPATSLPLLHGVRIMTSIP